MSETATIIWAAVVLILSVVLAMRTHGRPPDWRPDIERTWRADHHLDDEIERVRQIIPRRMMYCGFGTAFLLMIVIALLPSQNHPLVNWLSGLGVLSIVVTITGAIRLAASYGRTSFRKGGRLVELLREFWRGPEG